MPIPFLLAGLGVAAGVIGAGGHLSAKETNEKAQSVTQDAQELYDRAKASLELAQNRTETELLTLGHTKKAVLENSIKQFLQAYERIKNIQLSESVGLNEISNFAIDPQEAIQLREMANIYQSSFSSGATGAATGAVIALAASGSLPVVTGSLSVAGSALLAGEIGAATGIAGSALSFGATMTPLAAVAAPIVLFTGISSSIKADENLEKAQTMYAEAEVASEKMRTSETLCNAISDRSVMFNNLLTELNGMFHGCTQLLDGVTRKKTGLFRGKTINAASFTEEELKLVAVTRSLAGAVKAVIDTPMLNESGSLSNEAQDVYDNTTKKLPNFKEAVIEVESYDFKAKGISVKEVKRSKSIGNVNENASLLSLKGSIGRRGFFLYGVLYSLILFIIALFTPDIVIGVAFILYIYLNLALVAKRFRDLNASPWFIILYLIPVVGILVHFMLLFAKSKNQQMA